MSETSWAHAALDAALEQRVDDLLELVRELPVEAREALNTSALVVAYACTEAGKAST